MAGDKKEGDKMKSIIRKIFLIALRAYWRGNQHCGSDWSKECVEHCKDNDICKWSGEIKEELKKLK